MQPAPVVSAVGLVAGSLGVQPAGVMAWNGRVWRRACSRCFAGGGEWKIEGPVICIMPGLPAGQADAPIVGWVLNMSVVLPQGNGRVVHRYNILVTFDGAVH